MSALIRLLKHRPLNASTVPTSPLSRVRANWHTHPLGQTLLVTFGVGLTQEWGGPVQIIRQGDVVLCPPNVKHWHGAAPDTTMTHLAIGERLDGKSVTWMEQVSDEQYNAR